MIPHNYLRNVRYLLNGLCTLPLLPWLFLDAIRIRKNIPELPEAQYPEGAVSSGQDKSRYLLIIGESTMAGVGVSEHAQGFAGSLASMLSERFGKSIRWKVHSKSGYTVRQLNKEVLPQIEREKPDLVVVGIGANDAFQLTPPWRFRKDLQKMIQTLQASNWNSPIVFLHLPPISLFPAFTFLVKKVTGNHLGSLRGVLHQVTSEQENTYFIQEQLISPTEGTTKESIADYFSDGVHPSRLTYQLWAARTVDFITGHQLLS